ncbi:phosphoribosylanthranilate isomerase [Altererythrobacter atlanticus]|uniref:N-(5'-phosphoribosyl)anthranilate isomerase n=1 Tax=Croceibacterium atlanticum TaxID=1267766 RepID=A0A0F7KQ48_9SPHN|nr:phosphoribosylanthranilate isomerase [Croceibacterium atlanticum]AKH41256.1 N-(5'-phosphoribosyl)anthranilate isomerase [Croceibacterium atlanticum]MBB5732774.1 phosphoribosylanthranilate isomerase [Croceibacterium atlanticum]
MSEMMIKICGLSTPETVDAAVDAGATHIGLVHYEPSPRHVSLEQAAQLRRRIPERVKAVLLLVSMEAQPTVEALQAVQPDVVQFHGKETAEWLAVLKQHTSLEIWKAIGVKDEGSLERALKFRGAADRLLYDAAAGKLPGGNGLALDWSLLAHHRHEMPWGLAGGLTPDNVAEAIRQTGASLVDTSSGVESEPGVKDVDRIRAFCQAARES